jgi:S-methyl-5-thioribose-1-phosphate isomerase
MAAAGDARGSLESLRYGNGRLQVLDQLKIPQETMYVEVEDSVGAWEVIRSMQVRGAPLIAIVAALGLAVEAEKKKSSLTDAGAALAWLKDRTAYLRTSRPTAVNLFNAMDELDAAVAKAAAAGATVAELLAKCVSEAERLLKEDVETNRAIGEAGADAILAAMAAKGRADSPARVVTICNTGSLACAGFGTALGVVRALHARGKLERVYALETRPYLQGARLTAFEIVTDKLPGTLVCDSMAAALMRQGVDACVVGADRVVANGDTANKIGTYGLSILARHHGVPFFVASPSTTLDAVKQNGHEIPIEERPADELRMCGGIRLAPADIPVWNPAFDMTPASLITGIVTEEGLIPPHKGDRGFDVAGFLKEIPEKKRRRVA